MNTRLAVRRSSDCGGVSLQVIETPGHVGNHLCYLLALCLIGALVCLLKVLCGVGLGLLLPVLKEK